MIVFWLVLLISVEPGPTFGVLGSYPSNDQCEKAKAKLDEKYQDKLACLGVVAKPLKEI